MCWFACATSTAAAARRDGERDRHRGDRGSHAHRLPARARGESGGARRRVLRLVAARQLRVGTRLRGCASASCTSTTRRWNVRSRRPAAGTATTSAAPRREGLSRAGTVPGAKHMKAKLIGINHVALEVGDIDEALEWYGRCFEFTLRESHAAPRSSTSATSSSRSSAARRTSRTEVATSASSSTTRRRPGRHFARPASPSRRRPRSTSATRGEQHPGRRLPGDPVPEGTGGTAHARCGRPRESRACPRGAAREGHPAIVGLIVAA